MAETMTIKLKLTEDLLGTAPANPDLLADFVAGKAPDPEKTEEEMDAVDVPAEIQKSSTVFARRDGAPILWDYQIKGFFKDACGMLRRIPETGSNKLKAHKKVVDGLIFVTPRAIPLVLPEGKELTWCERPLRAQTAQGERIALARSEAAPAGTTLEFQVLLLDAKLVELVEDWLEYGALRGLGQWRNSGMGRFEVVSLAMA